MNAKKVFEAALIACTVTFGAWGLGLSATRGARASEVLPVRFLAVGDAGRNNAAQHAVARGMAQVCATRGCDFVVYLGDNFYENGVESLDDPEFQSSFEVPYAQLVIPFYPVNGNHDLDWNGNSYQAWKADLYVQYTDRSDKWNMPAPYYAVRRGDVELFGLDTTQLLHGDTEAQRAWLLQALDASTASWKVVFGHHPYRSNGEHGNAPQPLESVLSGVACGRADLYLAGHDHTLQWLVPTCGVELLVSGAGAGTNPIVERGNPTRFQDDQRPGFVWIELTGDQMTGEFYDADAALLFARTVTRQ